MPFVYFRMELVWHGEFDRLFSQYFPHMWCLVPTFYPPGDSWRTFKDSAKVRFSCQVNIYNYTTTQHQCHPLLVNMVHIRQAYPTQSNTCCFPCLYYQYATALPTSDSIARYIHILIQQTNSNTTYFSSTWFLSTKLIKSKKRHISV